MDKKNLIIIEHLSSKCQNQQPSDTVSDQTTAATKQSASPKTQRVIFKQSNFYKLTVVYRANICSVSKPESESS
jgi:hypothetical protein